MKLKTTCANQGEAQEQEAQENLVEIDLSLEAQAILAYSHRVYNRDKILAELKRANPHTTKQKHKKSFLLCSQAQKLFKTVMHKLQTQERVLLNSKYISKITGCDSTDQNKRIMEQLAILLEIDYHRLAIVDGTPYNYHYSFELHPAIIEELKEAGLWNLESMPALMRVSYNNIPNTSNRSIRSRANFANVKNSNSENSNTELEETSKEIAKEERDSSLANQPITENVETTQEPEAVETINPTQTPITRKSEDTPRLSNVISNGFLGGDKRLSEIQQYLTDEFCEKLRTACGRDFTNKAIRQITKSIAVSEKGQHASFKHVNGILSYLTPAFANEKRDAVKTASEHYYTQAGMTAAELQQHATQAEREKYLKETEDRAIHCRTDEAQYRAKLANSLQLSQAYNFLSNLKTVRKVGNAFEVSMAKEVELTPYSLKMILQEANAIGGYSGVDKLEIVV